MLSAAQLAAMIAEEFLRVGASQQSWDQNFPKTPSVWVPGPRGPVLSDESRTAYEAIANSGGIGSTAPVTELVCPPGTLKEYINGRWQCTAVGGRVADPEGEILLPPPGSQPAGGSGGLPPFVGGRLGKVLYTPIPNRNLNGIRIGVLPRVVMGDEAPGSYGSAAGWASAAGGGSENVEP